MGWSQNAQIIAESVSISGGTPGSGLFVYSSTPRNGDLVGAWSGSSGTDKFGNFFRAGLTSQENTFGTTATINGSQMQFNAPQANPLLMQLSTNGLLLYNSSGAASGNLLLSLAKNAGTDSFGNAFNVGFQGQAITLVNQGSNPPAGTAGPTLYSDNTGTALGLTSSSGMQPQLVAGNTDTALITVTQTTATRISKTYQIQASDAQGGTVYRVKCGGNGGQGSTAQSLHLGINIGGVTEAEVALSSTIIPINANFCWDTEFLIYVTANGVTGTIEVTQRGAISIFGNTLTNANSLGFAGQNSNISLNTTTLTGIFVYAFWFANTGAPSISSFGSTFERLGA